MDSHRPVMLEEALAGLAVRPGGCYIDATFGRGGHAAAILEQLGDGGWLQGFDQDPEAVATARTRFGDAPNFGIRYARFDALGEWVVETDRVGAVDGVLMDLGVSSPQLDNAARGFSFQHDGPLDMRMDPERGEPVADWLSRASAEEIADVLYIYGEERASRRIARAIVAARVETPITTTGQLAEIVRRTMGRRGRIHPATRSFQALRIFINDELGALEAGLARAAEILAPGGRLVVISFHSLEDRIVKRFIRDASQLKAVQRVLADEQHARDNPRARSAVLRAAELRA
ncbi:16S rRNA (cytosine(1402)-N(4))-methyltransferase RsmH [Algiphilus aromaticivorans]|uniref:16S rRNA (cytosine(1402)-N(4))-methyltransferase RsmH n=1 Tax=Algiphilus aromaticivorans TaxID=382454 RepID=UPI0005C14D56|nr:16S rRNA (cytosine(1402)-N(4))-methyltransferase RsmH [Algiphilus aromaticivorans]